VLNIKAPKTFKLFLVIFCLEKMNKCSSSSALYMIFRVNAVAKHLEKITNSPSSLQSPNQVGITDVDPTLYSYLNNIEGQVQSAFCLVSV